MRLYVFIATISWIIRNYYLPNPFECFGQYAELINLGMEPVLYFATYYLVSLIYRRGSFPTLGSLLYLFFYIIHVLILQLMGYYNFSIIWVVIIFLCYAFIIKKLSGIICSSY